MKYQSTDKCVFLWLFYIYHSEHCNTSETSSCTSRKLQTFRSWTPLHNTFGHSRHRRLKRRCKFFLWLLKSSRTDRVHRSEVTLQSKRAPVLMVWGWIVFFPWCRFLHVHRRFKTLWWINIKLPTMLTLIHLRGRIVPFFDQTSHLRKAGDLHPACFDGTTTRHPVAFAIHL